VRRRRELATVATALLAACSAPERPYGHPAERVAVERDRAALATDAVAPASSVDTTRTLVIGALDDLTVQPIGALYDTEVGIPLEATYFYWALESKLRDELHRSFARRLPRVFKDSLDLGEPIPVGRPPGLLLLRGSIESFAFSRHADAGVDVVRGVIALRLLEGDTGRQLWSGAVSPEVAVRDPATDPFGRFAEAVVAALFSDTTFARSVAGGWR
jgi:hypothetical protein